jgi:hypothetical protein
MDHKTKERYVCNDQTNIDYWSGLGLDWLQRLLDGSGGRLESIFEVPENAADASEYGGLYVQTVFPRRVRP